jgi:Ca2+-binding RTX toxin-like protein
MALMVALFAAAAYADVINGTSGPDRLRETCGNDTIYGYGGADRLIATQCRGDVDQLYGGRGKDFLNADDGDKLDIINGGRGFDTCWGDQGDRFVKCERINRN